MHKIRLFIPSIYIVFVSILFYVSSEKFDYTNNKLFFLSNQSNV